MSDLHWVKSSFSDAGGNNCVEVAAVEHERVAIRESDSPAALLVTSRTALGALARGLKVDGPTPPFV
ncbi:DUF397 domain-containing protein [Streptomyces sp. NPDC058239]|uniref:DUF397 domain-containing protein n=1 Tax=Streptomyces sp. NPDC058239 TaxID=3346395 RepID=UPI0036E61DE0